MTTVTINTNTIETEIENAINEIHGVQFIDNTPDEAREARTEVERIIREFAERIVNASK